MWFTGYMYVKQLNQSEHRVYPKVRKTRGFWSRVRAKQKETPVVWYKSCLCKRQRVKQIHKLIWRCSRRGDKTDRGLALVESAENCVFFLIAKPRCMCKTGIAFIPLHIRLDRHSAAALRLRCSLGLTKSFMCLWLKHSAVKSGGIKLSRFLDGIIGG